MPPFFFPENAIVTTTGIFKFINAKSWIQTHGGKYVVWSPRITHILVGTTAESWKLQHLSSSVRILHESEIVENLRSDLWVDRYRPKTVHDVIGHTSQMNDLLKWLREFPNPKTERAALLTGPPGIGKTTVAHAVARQVGYDIVEFNASDERSAKAVRELFEKAVKGSCIQTTSSTKRLIIMDEVDGMSAGDRGGVVEIAKICKISPFPIICIANDGKSPKLRPLVSATLEVKFARPTKTTIAKALMASVVKQENLTVKQAELELMCEQNGNDIRSIVNSLQFDALTTGKSAAKDKDEVHRLDIFTASARIFNPSTAFDERMNMAFFDHGMVPLMVAEGYIGAADKAKVPAGKDRDLDGLERCVKAGEYVGMWDILDRRIHQTQNWGLLPGAVAAIASAAKTANGTAPYPLFATWLGKNSKRTKHRRLLSELRTHMGSTSADPALLDTRDTLRSVLFTPALNPTQVVNRLQELKLTRDDMMETLVETCFKGEEKTVEMDTKKKTAITREWKKLAPKTMTGKKEEADSEEADDIIDPFDEEEIDVTMI